MTFIKICGITNKEDAVEASRLGVDLVGFVFCKESPRYVDPEEAGRIVSLLSPFIARVGVFVDADPDIVMSVARLAKLDILQFHGSETPEYCRLFKDVGRIIKAFRIKAGDIFSDIDRYKTDFYLLDTYVEGVSGGTGQAFDWSLLKDIKFLSPVILSGGLTPENVNQAINMVEPYAVDVSSGVEVSPGKKDAGRMKRFVENARKAR